MKAIFNKEMSFVGWINEDEYIFDKRLKWIGFIHGNQAFSVTSYTWLGSVSGTTLQDRLGRPVAFNPELAVRGGMPPHPPIPPVPPAPPATPLPPDQAPASPSVAEPPGGWSNMSFEQWLTQ